MNNTLRCILVSDFTIDVLKMFLSSSQDFPHLEIIVAPFGQVVPVLNNDEDPLWDKACDLLVIWTRPEALIPSFADALSARSFTMKGIEAECIQVITAVRRAARRSKHVVMVNWALPEYIRGCGPIDLKKDVGCRYALLSLNKQLVDGLCDLSNVFLFDSGRWLQMVGEKACDPRFWFTSKVPYDPAVFKHAARDIKAMLLAIQGRSRKIVVLDLDNTLWGGVVGETGWEKLKLGGHDPVGEAFVAFQRALLTLKQRGIILALASKNDEYMALEALDRHPEMVLRRADFAAWRIDWNDKALNIEALVKELNLGMDSVVFIDDNPAERDRVRGALPKVLVPEWPENPLLFAKALLSLDCFDTIFVGYEDRRRQEMYQETRQRDALKEKIQSREDWLASLKTVLTVEIVSRVNLPRVIQLINKTNQMNLASRRLTDEEFYSWISVPGHSAFAFRVADRFGDSGLVGVATMEILGKEANIVDFILSCRAFGRDIENAMLKVLSSQAKKAGVSFLRATYVPTERNKPCFEFLSMRSGFVHNGDVFIRSVIEDGPFPEHLSVVS